MRRVWLGAFFLVLAGVCGARAAPAWVDSGTVNALKDACTALGQQDCTRPKTMVVSSTAATKLGETKLGDALTSWCHFKGVPHGKYPAQPCGTNWEGIEQAIKNAIKALHDVNIPQALAKAKYAYSSAANTGPPPYKTVYGFVARCVRQNHGHEDDCVRKFFGSDSFSASQPLGTAAGPSAASFYTPDPSTIGDLSAACVALSLTNTCTLLVPPAPTPSLDKQSASTNLANAENDWCSFRKHDHPPGSGNALPCSGQPSDAEAKPELVLFLIQSASGDLNATPMNLIRAQKEAMLAYSAAETGPPPYIKPKLLQAFLRYLRDKGGAGSLR